MTYYLVDRPVQVSNTSHEAETSSKHTCSMTWGSYNNLKVKGSTSSLCRPAIKSQSSYTVANLPGLVGRYHCIHTLLVSSN